MIDIQASIQAAKRQSAEGCVKTVEDLDRYRTVIAATDPELIVECGSFSGKSALWFTKTAGCPVVTIDVDDNIIPEAYEAGVTFIQASSIDPDTVAKVAAHPVVVAGGRVMVVLDSNHSAAHVLSEIRSYAPMVGADQYLVVEDGLVRWMPWEPYDGSPLDAIETWLSQNPDWEADEVIENAFPVTQFPSGWLRRRR